MPHLVICVCTGNICRSPMAEHMLRAGLRASGNWEVLSAGVAAASGRPASIEAVRVMRQRGIDISAHASRPLNRELAEAADLIVVMTRDHRDMIKALYPEVAEKVRVLKTFDPTARHEDLMDPIGMSENVYRQVSLEIEGALPGLITHLEAME